MQNHGNKLLLGFLGFGIIVYLLSMFYGEEPSVVLSTDDVDRLADLLPDKENPSAGLSKDASDINSDVTTAPAIKIEQDNPVSDALGYLDSPEVSVSTSDSSTARSPVEAQPVVSERKISLENYALKVDTSKQWKLPGRLQEISGLAMTTDDRLLAHNDEKGVIYEIDYQKGQIVKAFQLADIAKPIAADFEGIAAVDNRVYLVTSSGRLYECSEGTDGESVLFNIYTTGVGRDYEIEGLAYDASQRALLLITKDARRPELKGQLVIYHWAIDKKQLNEGAHIVMPIIGFSRQGDAEKFQPSGIERHPVSGNYFVVAARQGAIAEVTPEGQVVAVKQFPAEQHRQTEGITFAADGTLIVADEGVGKKARITLYPVSESE